MSWPASSPNFNDENDQCSCGVRGWNPHLGATYLIRAQPLWSSTNFGIGHENLMAWDVSLSKPFRRSPGNDGEWRHCRLERGYNRQVSGLEGAVQSDFRLGPWLVKPSLNTVSQNGSTTRLEPKVMEVLVCLAASVGEPVSKETILKTVWPG